MVRAGRLSERITFYRPEVRTYGGPYVRDGYMQPNYVDVPEMHTQVVENVITETFASVHELDFKNQMVAAQEDWMEALRFKIRYRPGLEIKNGDMLKWRGQIMEIVGNPSYKMHRREIEVVARWQG